jgi:hypothetical protein
MNAKLTSRLGRLTLCSILCCFGDANLRADAAIFTDYFDGTQPKAARLEGPGCHPTQFPYFDSGTFQVSSSEGYEVFSAGRQTVIVGVYTGTFNPGNVSQNRLALLEGVGGYGLTYRQLDLQSGTDYRLIVQPTCQQNEQSGITTDLWVSGSFRSPSIHFSLPAAVSGRACLHAGVFNGEPLTMEVRAAGMSQRSHPHSRTGLYFSAHTRENTCGAEHVYDAR